MLGGVQGSSGLTCSPAATPRHAGRGGGRRGPRLARAHQCRPARGSDGQHSAAAVVAEPGAPTRGFTRASRSRTCPASQPEVHTRGRCVCQILRMENEALEARFVTEDAKREAATLQTRVVELQALTEYLRRSQAVRSAGQHQHRHQHLHVRMQRRWRLRRTLSPSCTTAGWHRPHHQRSGASLTQASRA